jgi:hypothetical protein
MEMRNKITAKFPGQSFPSYMSDKIYIMDYTNQTQNQRSIECSTTTPNDIDAFIIHNNMKSEITFCAFSDNNIKLDGEIKERRHCEGVLFPTINNDSTWLVFLELKYPKKKNLGENLKSAREQLLFTLNLFREQGIIEHKRLVYLIFSAPKYNEKTPFESFCMKPEDLKILRRTSYAIIRGVNEITVINDLNLEV